MGIRTPWTLSSDLSWDKTHRLGGRLFFAWGLLVMILTLLNLLPPMTFFIGVFSLLFVILIGLAIYSYQVWREDPEHR